MYNSHPTNNNLHLTSNNGHLLTPVPSDTSAAGFAEALPVLTDHLAFLDRSIQRPLREYNDCQVGGYRGIQGDTG